MIVESDWTFFLSSDKNDTWIFLFDVYQTKTEWTNSMKKKISESLNRDDFPFSFPRWVLVESEREKCRTISRCWLVHSIFCHSLKNQYEKWIETNCLRPKINLRYSLLKMDFWSNFLIDRFSVCYFLALLWQRCFRRSLSKLNWLNVTVYRFNLWIDDIWQLANVFLHRWSTKWNICGRKYFFLVYFSLV